MSKVLSLRISDELFNQLDGLTKTTKRSRSFLTSKAIEEYISRNSWKTKELHQAVEEANKGVFVSNESVEDWLSSWGDVEEKTAPKADIFPE
ncbi:MAG: CopG family ribbon-helix-helix protein [Gammaproteobacteria bacterium]|nr:CopG family ribbon-helix-helix protein [Gammaproteobacteria bacterium]